MLFPKVDTFLLAHRMHSVAAIHYPCVHSCKSTTLDSDIETNSTASFRDCGTKCAVCSLFDRFIFSKGPAKRLVFDLLSGYFSSLIFVLSF